MAKIRSNKLTLEPLGGGKFRLFGYIDTPNKQGVFVKTKIRMLKDDLTFLETEKRRMEEAAEANRLAVRAIAGVQQTFLTPDQLRDAEAAYRRLPPGRTLFECVEAADLILGTGEPITCVDALAAWVENMKARRLEQTTTDENETRVKRFLRLQEPKAPKMVHEITPKMTEDYIRREGPAPITALGDARVLSAWGNFCARQKYIRRNFVQLDIAELKERARPKSAPKILTPEQSEALLLATIAANDGEMTLFTIFSLWCFMRPSEVLRLRPDDVHISKGENGRTPGITVHLRGKKIGSTWRTVPVPVALEPLVIACMERGDMDKETGISFSDWDWKHIRARAGLLELVASPKRLDRHVIKKSFWTPDILRHTGMSYLFQKTNDVAYVTQLGGNSEAVAFMHYLSRAEVDAFLKFYAITGQKQDCATPAVVQFVA